MPSDDAGIDDEIARLRSDLAAYQTGRLRCNIEEHRTQIRVVTRLKSTLDFARGFLTPEQNALVDAWMKEHA